MSKKYFFILFSIISVLSQAQGNIENIEKLKGVLSEEDYIILTNAYSKEGKQIFNLMINGELKSKDYLVWYEKGNTYFSFFNFLEAINFKNYTQDPKNGNITLYLGENLERVVLSVKDNYIDYSDEKIKLNQNDLLLNGREIYINSELFKKVFLNNLRIDNERQKINMNLNFSSPEEINVRLNLTKNLVKEEKEKKEIIFKNKNKAFELGYLRTEANKIFTRDKNSDDSSFKDDWEARLEYQGAFLFGELNAEYDLKEHLLGDVKLAYDEIYNKHTLELSSFKYGDNGARENGIRFWKDKGYLVTGSKDYILKENVPIGSRVELIYLGSVIDIQTAINGEVIFNNKNIKEDREYILRVYTEDGKIYEKIINTTSDYNQQNKGEWEYDFDIREDHESNRYRINAMTYYGLTDSLTAGAGYIKEPRTINEKFEYVDKGRGELVFSNSLKGYQYTLRVGGEKTFNNYVDDITLKSTDDEYKYDFLGQIDLQNFRLKYQQENFGEYYYDKFEKTLGLKYKPLKSLELEWEKVWKEKYSDLSYSEDEIKQTGDRFRIEYSKSYKSLLATAEYEKSTLYDEEDQYSLNLYYTGFRTFTTRLENTWKENGKYETAFSVFSNGNDLFDYTLEARYSEEKKDSLTFRFNLNYNNWFNFESEVDKKGNQQYKVGIDRITDLRNPKANIKSIESSPVEVTAFIDLNNNDELDNGEVVAKNIEVKLAGETKKTNKDGKAIFFGIPNRVLYDLNAEIKRPSLIKTNIPLKVEGRNTATIKAYLPIKPMTTLTGQINVAEILELSNLDKMRIYENIIVTIKDISGNELETTMPDETGIFQVSGLLPTKYLIEVKYIGIDYSIKGINEVVQLSYIEKGKDGNLFVFNFTDKSIQMKRNI
ncbi:carboxypeptidase-like regulatory domain-containing protein [Fusobacterium sp. SYSU M8D902]|uniref:carboxypeptidase-like regulatory domain-containing protein n=1 Tax=Fusobacterium sp. SYSU M8D902 TaxID=3159562 RepID=UPI0032E46C53